MSEAVPHTESVLKCMKRDFANAMPWVQIPYEEGAKQLNHTIPEEAPRMWKMVIPVSHVPEGVFCKQPVLYTILFEDFLRNVIGEQINQSVKTQFSPQIEPSLIRFVSEVNDPGKIEIYATEAGREMFEETDWQKFITNAQVILRESIQFKALPDLSGTLKLHALIPVNNRTGWVGDFLSSMAAATHQNMNSGWLRKDRVKEETVYRIDRYGRTLSQEPPQYALRGKAIDKICPYLDIQVPSLDKTP